MSQAARRRARDLPLPWRMTPAPPRVDDVGDDAGAALLDEVFDRAVRAFSENTPLDVDDLVAAQPSLRPRVEGVVRLARRIALVQRIEAPTVAGYDLLEELGAGGMGVVWLARQRTLGRLVALKVLPPAAAASSRGRARFAAEARALARVRHPALVQVFDVVASDAVCAYAMELIEGRSLAQILAGMRTRQGHDSGAFFAELGVESPEGAPLHVVVCRLFVQVLRAIAALHRQGLVHRDVKPSNILVRNDGHPVLSDLGLVLDEDAAAMTRTGQFVGTPAYAAAEQLRGERADAAVDVWAAGVALFEALTRVHPFAARDEGGVRTRILGDTPTRLRAVDRSLPRDLETIVGKAIAHEPAQRYASADAFADDLERLLSLQPIAAVPASLAVRARKAMRRHRALWIAAALGVVVAALLGTLLVMQLARQAGRPGRAAEAVRRARLHLLLPTFAEQTLIAVHSIPGQYGDRLHHQEASLAQAIAAYEDADQQWPLDATTSAEHEVVRATHSGESLSTALCARCPLTATVADGDAFPTEGEPRLVAASRADRRALGLLAFLRDEVKACHAAWAGLDLREDIPDPLVDAASGTLHLIENRPALALPRLLAARRAFPEAGFLCVDAADAACRLGDPGLAEQLLATAQSLSLQDPYETHLRVHMDVLAARGRIDDALAVLADLRTRHQACVARDRMADRLCAVRRYGEALHLWLDLNAEMPGAPWLDPNDDKLVAALDGWWRSLSFRELIDALSGTAPSRIDRFSLSRLMCTHRDHPPSSSAQSVTLGRGSSASEFWRPDWRDLELTSEILAMTTPQSWRARPLARRLVASAALAIDSLLARSGIVGWAPPEVRSRLRTWLGRAGLSLMTVGTAMLSARGSAQSSGWTLLAPANHPSARRLMPSTIDPQTNRVVAYGGYLNSPTPGSDFWTWTGTNWQLLSAAANPGPREGAALSADPTGGVLLFGGWDGTNYTSSTWRWWLGTWTQLSAAGPSPRESAVMVLDPVRNVVVLYGGRLPDASLPSGRTAGDTWEWDGIQWTQRHPATSPPPLDGHGMIYHPIRHRVMIFGGHTTPGALLYNDIWEWDGVNWAHVEVQGTQPGVRWTHGMSFDPLSSKVVVFGGGNYGGLMDEMWEFDGVAWTQRQVQGPQPSPRSYLLQAYDPATHSILIFGGYVGGGSDSTDETWLYGVPGSPVDGQQTTVDTSLPLVSAFAGQATITVTPKNAAGTPLGAGLTVTLSTTAGTLLGAVTDNNDGTYTQVLQAAPGAPSATVSATVNTIAITDTATVTFVPVDPTQSTITVNPDATFLGGHSLVTVTPKDNLGVAVGAGLTVALQTTLGALTGSVTDNNNGTYTQRLDATQLGTAAISATVNGLALPPASLTILDGSLGAVIGVRTDNNAFPYDSIQQAVSRATTDQLVRILVNPGTYDEVVHLRNRSNLQIEGLSSLGLVTVRGFRLSDSSDITIAYFDIDGSQRARHGIKLLGGCNHNQRVVVHDCFIHDVQGTHDGIRLGRDNCHVALRNLRIERSGGDGISMADGPCEVTISDVTILSSGLDGIRTADEATVRIERCRIENSGTRGHDREGYGIFRQRHRTGFAALITVIANTFTGNRGRVVANKSTVNLGNYDQMLDGTDAQGGF